MYSYAGQIQARSRLPVFQKKKKKTIFIHILYVYIDL